MKKTRPGEMITLASGVIVIVGLVAFVIWQWPQISHLFSNPTEIRTYVASFGIWAPVIFVSLYVFQIIVAPIPGTLMNFAGGLLFGWWKGVFFSWASCIIGAAISISIMRAFGRSLMRIFISEEKLDRFDGYVRSRGWVYLFLLYIVPNPIGDAVNYMSALSNIKLWKLLLMVAVGRLPSLIVGSWLGKQSVHFKTIHWILLGIGFVVMLVGVYLIHKPLENLAIRLSARLFPPRSSHTPASQSRGDPE
jgi:uncharacterized membrane protein YdjX (TVP38/TMEM64 family)